MKRLKQYNCDGDEWIRIECPKCKGKQGIRRKDSLIVNCYVCNFKIGRFEL